MDIAKEKEHKMVVTLIAKQGKENALKEALNYVAEQSRKEPHCLKYEVYSVEDRPGTVFLYEIWQTPALHKTQFEKDYVKDLIAQSSELVESYDTLVLHDYVPVDNAESA